MYKEFNDGGDDEVVIFIGEDVKCIMRRILRLSLE
jgi:hypothetical protein